MGTLGEEADNFQPQEKLNAADLDFLSVDMPLKLIKKTKQDGEEYSYKAYVEGNKEYYVADKVLELIKEIRKLKPTATKFKVRKTGSGLSTKYKVELLQ